jgi:hypothetical protein
MTAELTAEVDRHAKAAKKIIAAWEKHGLPPGAVDENLRMISDELELLDRMAIAHPRRAKGLRRLAERYRGVGALLVESVPS